MNRLSKVLITLSAALSLTVPACAAGQVMGSTLGGLDTLAMALVLAAFMFLLQKFLK